MVNRTFKAVVQKTRWGIDAVLKAMHILFDDSPAKRKDYRSTIGPDVFPLPFCGLKIRKLQIGHLR